jgi:hypothetical protein
MLEYLQKLALDPTAPIPAGWPHGWWGVLMLFCIPGGLGIPPGVLLGHHDGLGPTFMTILYFISDVVLAFVFEPLIRLLALMARSIPKLARAGALVMMGIERTMPPGSFAGPLGLVLMGFGAGLPFGRALGAAAGYALVPSWLLSISGDMCNYLIGMSSTLWFEGIFGDPRMAALAGIVVMVVVPLLVRRLRTPAA